MIVETFPTERCGVGLRALQNFAPKERIIQYTGEVVTESELVPWHLSEEVRKEAKKYAFKFDDNGKLFLNAARIGSPYRFINHSCSPDCTFQRQFLKRRLCIIICAGEGGGEER